LEGALAGLKSILEYLKGTGFISGYAIDAQVREMDG
jgi:hypothetical protein